MHRVLFILGTRPEAIKLCPVIAQMCEHGRGLKPAVCVTAQHREMLDQVLAIFDTKPDYDLNIMTAGQTLYESTSRILSGLEPIFRDRFDLAVVQGDTTTTFCAALAAFYARTPVAHIEAGLRTGDYDQPYPEEMNRVLTTKLARLHFAATQQAVENLRHDGVPNESIYLSGNPVIDAVTQISSRLEQGLLAEPEWPWLDATKKLILVTAHRRENFGGPFEEICRALRALAQRSDVQIAYPVHPNPNVRSVARQLLQNEPNIVLLEPLSYVPFVDLMRRSYLLLTDSGGIQEEGPSLGKPVLVMRESTERPEAVEAGVAKIVGADQIRIVEETSRLLDDAEQYESMARTINPYGDGRASERIVNAIRDWITAR